MKKQGYQPQKSICGKPPDRGSSVRESGYCNKCGKILDLEEKIKRLEKEILRR